MTLKFKEGDYVVYPAHGVGKLTGIERHTIGGSEMELFVILFEKDRMTLRLPKAKADAAGLRPIATKEYMREAVEILKLKTRSKRSMWSRRAQEYEAKINSGDPVNLASVLRELYRSQKESDQSYSERQIYQQAMERFVREYAIVQNVDEQKAIEHIESVLDVA